MEAFLERMDGLNPCHMSKCEVALSFAGEQRLYVEAVARTLQSRRVSVFYDEFETVRLWRRHLAEKLQLVYEGARALAVMFISADYVEKMWPRHERRAILRRAVEEHGEYVWPVRFDDLEVPAHGRGGLHGGSTDYCDHRRRPGHPDRIAPDHPDPAD